MSDVCFFYSVVPVHTHTHTQALSIVIIVIIIIIIAVLLAQVCVCLCATRRSTNNNVDGRHPNIQAGMARKQTGTVSTSVRVPCDR